MAKKLIADERREVSRIRERLRSGSGYTRLVEGVNTSDVSQMAEDLRALLKVIARMERKK